MRLSLVCTRKQNGTATVTTQPYLVEIFSLYPLYVPHLTSTCPELDQGFCTGWCKSRNWSSRDGCTPCSQPLHPRVASGKGKGREWRVWRGVNSYLQGLQTVSCCCCFCFIFRRERGDLCHWTSLWIYPCACLTSSMWVASWIPLNYLYLTLCAYLAESALKWRKGT